MPVRRIRAGAAAAAPTYRGSPVTTPSTPRKPMQRPLPSTVQVAGRSILAIRAGMAGVKFIADKVLVKHGLGDVKPDGWYPVESQLATLDEIVAKVGPFTLRSIGKEVPTHLTFPPDINTIEKALASIEVAYRMNHRGGAGADLGRYVYKTLGERKGQLVCANPYPCDLDLGITEALADRFRPKQSLWVKVVHDPAGCRKTGSSSCTYTVEW